MKEIDTIKNKVIAGHSITKVEASEITELPQPEIPALFAAASELRDKFIGNSVDLCAIINAKSGACPEDCTYCAQSSKNKSEIAVYPLASKKTITDKAEEAKDAGVKRFCIVTSGRKAGKKELDVSRL